MMDLVVRAPRLPVIGESLLSHSFRTSPGGKGGNQAIAAARLGASVTMIGQVGADRFGEILRADVIEEQIGRLMESLVLPENWQGSIDLL